MIMDIMMNRDFLVGKKLIQVCFSLYQLKLIFEDDVVIEVGNEIEYCQDCRIVQNWNNLNRKNNFSIHYLLNSSIIEASVENLKNLNLRFENGHTLSIKAAQDGNESYIIYNKNDFQVIY